MRYIRGFLKVVCYILILLFSLFPIYWIVLMSFKQPADVIAHIPKFIFKPTLENYKGLFSSTGFNFIRYIKNSLIICSGAVGVTVVAGLPAAFALTRLRFKARENLAFTFLSFRFAPELAIILPLYVIFRKLNLYDTYPGLIWIYQLITLPLFIWMMMSHYSEIPRELEEAALIDGASWWKIFWKVDTPIVLGGIAASVILAFVFAWNNFMFGLVLGGQKTQPVTVGALGFMSYEQVHWGKMAASAVIGMVPSVILASFFLRYLVKGLTMGALKD